MDIARADPPQIRPRHLMALGFFGHDQKLLRLLAETLERTTDQDTRPLAESILTRIQELSPGPAYLAAHDALTTIEHNGSTDQRWWIPEDIPTPPSSDPVPTGPIEFTRVDVDRVLNVL